MRGILLIFGAVLAVTVAAADNRKIVCYWGSWTVYRPGDGRFDLSYIDPNLCTHMIYSFIGLSPSGEVTVLDSDVALPSGKDNYRRFNELRKQNPSLKTMIAMGGWNEGSMKYSMVVGDPKLRQKMIDNIVAFLKEHSFDGFDLDWEYPVEGGVDNGRPVDYKNYPLLLKELRERFDREGLLLSAAVGPAEFRASTSYNIPEISKYLHFINLMVYDLHGDWDQKTGMHAAVYAAPTETGVDAKLNVDAIIKYWLSQGAPAEKLILGVPFYGKSFTLSSSQSHEVGTPASKGANGPYTGLGGMLGYNEICLKIKNENWQMKYDEERKAVYAYGGDQWVSYDDVKTLKEKTDYIKKYNLGGAMVWSIETDDFHGKCGPKWPLLNALNRELGSGASSGSTQPKQILQSQEPQEPVEPQQAEEPQEPRQPEQPQPEQPQEPEEPQQPETPVEPYTTQQPQESESTLEPETSEKLCQAEGYVRDPKDCGKFIYCQFHDNVYREVPFQCPSTLVYDVSKSMCDWPNKVQC